MSSRSSVVQTRCTTRVALLYRRDVQHVLLCCTDEGYNIVVFLCYTDEMYNIVVLLCCTDEMYNIVVLLCCTDEMYNIVVYMPDDVPFFCRVCLPRAAGGAWPSLVERDMCAAMQHVVVALLASRSAVHLLKVISAVSDLVQHTLTLMYHFTFCNCIYVCTYVRTYYVCTYVCTFISNI